MEANRPAEKSFSRVAEAIPDLEFTGERIVPGKTEEALFREHEERYVFAGRYVEGKDVLDVACGTGIGTAYLLHAGGRSCVGVDIDKGAIDYAKANYKGCMFAQSNATELPLPDASVDVVVSFETLEHLRDQRKFLVECRRVLRPGGMLICSTPNLMISRWGASNPYHVREFYPMEFKKLVESVFPSVELFGQKNQKYLSYVPKKMILRALERLQVRGTVGKILACGSDKKSLRTEFAKHASRFRESIIAYRWNFLSQPTFLIAVAHVTPAQGK